MAAMTAITLGLAIYGAVQSARGQYKAGQAAGRAAESTGQQFDYNASIADLQAQDAEQRGIEEESRFRSQVRGLIGSQRAGFAGQNVSVGDGSAADVQADTARLGEIDARTIRANAQREAWGYQVQAEDLRQGATIARQGGAAARQAGNAAAANTLIGAGSSLLLARYGFDNGGGVKAKPARYGTGRIGSTPAMSAEGMR